MSVSNSQAIQQAAHKLLSQPVWAGKNLEFWFTQIFPHAIEYMEEEYNNRAKQYQAKLAKSLSIKTLNDGFLGTESFELFYQEVRKRLSLMNDQDYEMFSELTELRLMFHKTRDLRIQILDDLLPLMQSWRDKGCTQPRIDLGKLIHIRHQIAEPGNIYITNIANLVQIVPKKWQPDDPKTTYRDLESDLTKIAQMLYSLQSAQQESLYWRKSMADKGDSLSPHAINRLADQWKHRGNR